MVLAPFIISNRFLEVLKLLAFKSLFYFNWKGQEDDQSHSIAVRSNFISGVKKTWGDV
jgi:hypothetical protein